MTVAELTPVQDVIFGLLALAIPMAALFTPLAVMEHFNK